LATFLPLRLAAVADDRSSAPKHHLGIALLRASGHEGCNLLERKAVGRAELGGEIDVPAKLQHPIPLPPKDGLALFLGQLVGVQVARLIGLERFAVFFFQKGHAEHVDPVTLARMLGIEHEGAGNIVVVSLDAGHVSPGRQLFCGWC
jgi:hypothetical protein